MIIELSYKITLEKIKEKLEVSSFMMDILKGIDLNKGAFSTFLPVKNKDISTLYEFSSGGKVDAANMNSGKTENESIQEFNKLLELFKEKRYVAVLEDVLSTSGKIDETFEKRIVLNRNTNVGYSNFLTLKTDSTEEDDLLLRRIASFDLFDILYVLDCEKEDFLNEFRKIDETELKALFTSKLIAFTTSIYDGESILVWRKVE